MTIETERLILREYTLEDFDALFEIMSDPETMQHYPKPFDEERTKGWIEWNLKNYKEYGFGSEAAKAARDWAFENTEYDCLYSYMKYTNIGSYCTAIANGMKKVKEYPDEKNKISYAYAITREEWKALKEVMPMEISVVNKQLNTKKKKDKQ